MINKFPTIPRNLGYQLLRLNGGPDGDSYVEFEVISEWTMWNSYCIPIDMPGLS